MGSGMLDRRQKQNPNGVQSGQTTLDYLMDLRSQGLRYQCVVDKILRPGHTSIDVAHESNRTWPTLDHGCYGGGRSDICGQTCSHGFVGIGTAARD